jgi:hypothetical protein
MARIELRDAIIRIVDGFSNTAAVDDTPANGDTNLDIDTLGTSGIIPPSSRFYINGAALRRTVVSQKGGTVITIGVGAASSGGFTLKVGDHATSATIAYNALASAVKSAIVATGVASADVDVTGTSPTYTITFKGSLNTVVTTVVETAVSLTDGTLAQTNIQTGGATWNIVFTPAITTADGVPADDAVITFGGRALEVKVGDGNLTFTENKEYNYDLDRGQLDTVREGNQVPMDVTFDFVWEFLTAIDGGTPTVRDALKQTGEASDWVSSSSDQCEPYCVDIEIEHAAPCADTEDEIIILPMFRHDKLNQDISKAQVNATGRCNSTEALITRV